ncbi:hypothetical protein [Methylocystis rosea]|uniref:hypothetical protein n=1 Tax=Methylocystis rosea TaxID=173366 RepID=UPI0018DB75F0|nr:hypothetical protein [Methylocystis rosea]
MTDLYPLLDKVDPQCAATEALAHRRRLRADDFRLNSSGKAFPFAKRQTKRFRDRELVSFDPGHLDLGFRRFVPEVHDKLHPPNQPSHRLAFPKEATLTFENLHTPHNLACSPCN